MRLTAELKKEHVHITSILSDVRTTAVSYSAATVQVLQARELFLTHTRKEDTRLYPPLRARLYNDGHLTELLKAFTLDFSFVSSLAADFFSSLDRGISEENFYTKLFRLSNALRERIEKEENILYAEFDRLFPEACEAGGVSHRANECPLCGQ